MLKKLYLGFGIVVILFYVVSSFVGYEATAPKEVQSIGVMRMNRPKYVPPSSSGGTSPVGGPYSTGSGPRGGK